jgi:hypothetical protein
LSWSKNRSVGKTKRFIFEDKEISRGFVPKIYETPHKVPERQFGNNILLYC